MQVIEPISVILLDFQMPRLNGIQVIEKIRYFLRQTELKNKLVKVKPPTFFFMTAYMSVALKKHLKELNVTEVFEKPLN